MVPLILSRCKPDKVTPMKRSMLSFFGSALDGLTQYFVDPIARIFGPSDDNYPAIGVHPFDGEPFAQRIEIYSEI